MLLNSVVMSLGVGITTLVARGVGAGDKEQVRKLMHHAILAIVFIGLPISLLTIALHRLIPYWMGAAPDILDTAAQYNLIVCIGRIFMTTSMMLNAAFRGYGDTKTPLYGNTAMNVINVIFNFLLIYPTRELNILGLRFSMFGAGLGVKGAAIATAIGMTVAGLFTLYVAFFRKGDYRIPLRGNWKIDWVLTKQIFRISLPAMLERIFMSSAGIITSRTIASLGTVNVAANSLCLTAESISFMPAFAFQTAVTTLVGQSLGAEKPELAERYMRTCVRASIVVMTVAGLGLFFFGRYVVVLFSQDEGVIALASQCLRIAALLQPAQTGAMVYAGGLRGAGDTLWPMIITASCMWFFRALIGAIVFIRILGNQLPAAVCWMVVDSYVRILLFYLRVRTGKWKTLRIRQA